MLARTESLHWSAEISDSFVAVLDEKALSELRLIQAEAHAAGMARVRRAQGSGGEWLSRTTMLLFEHLEDRRGVNVREAGS